MCGCHFLFKATFSGRVSRFARTLSLPFFLAFPSFPTFLTSSKSLHPPYALHLHKVLDLPFISNWSLAVRTMYWLSFWITEHFIPMDISGRDFPSNAQPQQLYWENTNDVVKIDIDVAST